MASYNITLKDPQGGLVGQFDCADDVSILDQLEEEGLDHPSSCRAGAC